MKYILYALGRMQWSILVMLFEDGGQLSTHEIAEALGAKHDRVQACLNVLHQRNLVHKALVRSPRPGRARSTLNALWSLNVARETLFDPEIHVTPKPDTDHWGIEIRDRREAALVTQRDLARASGLSQAMLSHIENAGAGITPSRAATLELALQGLEAGTPERRLAIIRKAITKLSVLEIRALDLEPYITDPTHSVRPCWPPPEDP